MMARNVAPDVMEGFVENAISQLNSIRTDLQAFRDDRSTDSLNQARRVIHRIKGEASMIGLSDFSHLAYFLENLVEQLVEPRPDQDLVLEVVAKIVANLSQYAVDLLNHDRDERESIKEGILAYRRHMNSPESLDQSVLDQVFHTSEPSADVKEVEGSPTADRRSTTIDPSQLNLFRQDVVDRLQVVTDLLSLDGDLDESELHEIRRSLHSVKGGAGVIGLQAVADLAHAIEGNLQRCIDGNSLTGDSRTLLRQGVDTLGELLESGIPAHNLTEIMNRLGHDPEICRHDSTTRPVSQESIDAIRLDLEHKVSDELLTVFREEAEDHIKQLYYGLNKLQADPHDRTQLQAIRRSAHTLKGAAGAVGLRVVTSLSHRMEDVLDRLYDGIMTVSTDILTVLLNTTDRLHDLSFGSYDNEEQLVSIVDVYGAYRQLLETSPLETSSEISLSTRSTFANEEKVPHSANAAEMSEETRDYQARSPFDRRTQDQQLRVPLSRIDELVRTVSELIINRTTFEQRMTDFVRCVEELRPVLGRLRGVSNEMETRSVDELRSGLAWNSCRNVLENRLSESNAPFDEFDPLEFDRYNEYHLMARTVAEASNDVNTITNELRTLIGDFDSLLVRQDRLSRDTQDRLMRIRMVPLATLATRLHRAVRVVATSQQKQVELLIDGEEIELDKTVLEEMADPLLHLLRNAVDHGVEPTDLRLVRGKPEVATIRIRAYYQGTQVVLRISDDGGGLDSKRIIDAAIKRGYVSPADADSMTDQEIFPYIFIPGLSTATQVSEVSGRGVGMDIVRDKVQRLKGTISVDSEPDKGTTFTICLPMTLAITRALMVVAGGELFAIPMQSVVQIARLDKGQIEKMGSNPVIRLDGTACPLIRLSDHLNLRCPEDEGATVPVFIVRSGDRQVAVRVERIVSGRDVVVKTLGTHLRKVHGLVGATLLGDGTIVPILDPNSISNLERATVPSMSRTATTSRDTVTTVMIVDDSVSVRRVMENLIVAQGWIPIVAKDGVEAIEILQSTDTLPDVFLLDIEMPRMDGFELLATLRSMPRYRETPVVIVTSRAGEKHRSKAISLGATDYLVKPYQDDELTSLIMRLRHRRESILA